MLRIYKIFRFPRPPSWAQLLVIAEPALANPIDNVKILTLEHCLNTSDDAGFMLKQHA